MLHVSAFNKLIISCMHTCSQPFVPKYSLISGNQLCCHGVERIEWVCVTCMHSIMRKVYIITTHCQR